jgi:hypothetical protein
MDRPQKMDTQQIELVGRAALEARLIQKGFEVARPNRDKGIDLIVFLDAPDQPFAALPIQFKSYTGNTFGVWRKYEGMTDLVLVYIWQVATHPRFFLMDYAEAAALIPNDQKRTDSWNRRDGKAGWSWTKVPEKVRLKVEEYEDRWQWLRDRLNAARRRPARPSP